MDVTPPIVVWGVDLFNCTKKIRYNNTAMIDANIMVINNSSGDLTMPNKIGEEKNAASLN